MCLPSGFSVSLLNVSLLQNTGDGAHWDSKSCNGTIIPGLLVPRKVEQILLLADCILSASRNTCSDKQMTVEIVNQSEKLELFTTRRFDFMFRWLPGLFFFLGLGWVHLQRNDLGAGRGPGFHMLGQRCKEWLLSLSVLPGTFTKGRTNRSPAGTERPACFFKTLGYDFHAVSGFGRQAKVGVCDSYGKRCTHRLCKVIKMRRADPSTLPSRSPSKSILFLPLKLENYASWQWGSSISLESAC